MYTVQGYQIVWFINDQQIHEWTSAKQTNKQIWNGYRKNVTLFGNTASKIYIAGMCLQKVLFLKIVSHFSCVFVNNKGNQNPNISDLLKCCMATLQCEPKISHIRTLLWTLEAQP